MGSLFSKSNKKSASNANGKRTNNDASITSKDKAILELKNARDRLKKYRTRVSETPSVYLYSMS